MTEKTFIIDGDATLIAVRGLSNRWVSLYTRSSHTFFYVLDRRTLNKRKKRRNAYTHICTYTHPYIRRIKET